MVDSTDLSQLRIERRDEPGGARRRRGRARVWGVLAAVLVLAAAVPGVYYVAQDRGPQVSVARAAVAGGARGGGLTANGYVVARTKASVSSKLAGRLAYLGVEEGDRVEAGQVLARLESAEYEAAVRQAEAEVLTAEAALADAEAAVIQARRERDRGRALFEERLIAEQALQDAETAADRFEAQRRAAESRLAAARALLAGARANLENTRIRAPFSGTVLRKDAEVGEVVAPAVAGGGLTRGAVVTMADLTTLEVEVDVNEAYIGEVRQGRPAAVTLDAYPGERFPAHVRQVVPTADRQKATVLVRVALDTADARILPEMGAQVVFLDESPEDGSGEVTPRARQVTVPAAAVRNEAGVDVVFIVQDGRATRREIEAGPVSGGRREVRRGLSGGEMLVLDPPAGLTDGVRVRVGPGH